MNEDSFAGEAKTTVIEAAHNAYREFEKVSVALENANPEDAYEIECDKDFYATQTELLIGLSIAKDLKRIADALERKG